MYTYVKVNGVATNYFILSFDIYFTKNIFIFRIKQILGKPQKNHFSMAVPIRP